jgi:hypothetical protein
MKFRDWMAIENLTYDQAAARLGVSNGTVARRYALGLALPNRQMMRRIFDATNGLVRPDDFYDLGSDDGVARVRSRPRSRAGSSSAPPRRGNDPRDGLS